MGGGYVDYVSWGGRGMGVRGLRKLGGVWGYVDYVSWGGGYGGSVSSLCSI